MTQERPCRASCEAVSALNSACGEGVNAVFEALTRVDSRTGELYDVEEFNRLLAEDAALAAEAGEAEESGDAEEPGDPEPADGLEAIDDSKPVDDTGEEESATERS